MHKIKELAIGGGTQAKDANSEMANDTVETPKSETGKAPLDPVSPTRKTHATATPSNQQSAASSTPVKAGSAIAPQSAIRGSVPAPASGSARKPAPSRGDAVSTLSTPVGAGHRKETSGTSSKSTSKAATPKATTSKATPTPRTARLTPSMTGPARRSSTAGTPGTSQSEMLPLRPQLTGTPSKPTASYLAKTRSPPTTTTPLERGTSVRNRLASGSPSPSPSGIKSPPTRSTLSSSGSRLMQGTAASRARATEVKSPPEKTAGAKAKTASATPSKATMRPNGQADVKRPDITTPSASSHVNPSAGIEAEPKVQTESSDITPVEAPHLHRGDDAIPAISSQHDTLPTHGHVTVNAAITHPQAGIMAETRLRDSHGDDMMPASTDTPSGDETSYPGADKLDRHSVSAANKRDTGVTGGNATIDENTNNGLLEEIPDIV